MSDIEVIEALGDAVRRWAEALYDAWSAAFGHLYEEDEDCE